MVKEEGLALTSCISGMLGVGASHVWCELTFKISIYRRNINVLCIRAIVGMNNVLGKVGVGGVPAFISIQKNFGLYILL